MVKQLLIEPTLKRFDFYKKAFGAIIVALSVSSALHAQDVALYRTSSDNAAVSSFTYPSSDMISYYDSNNAALSPSTSTSNLCGSAGRRVQTLNFVLNVKSTSISKIVIKGTSSGATSYRSLASITVGSTTLVKDADYTTTTSVLGSTCGEIVISGLKIPRDATNGTNITIKISGAADGSGSLSNLNLSEIDLTPTTTPLDFLSFTAKRNALNNSVELQWQTANEINTKEFLIEKKTAITEFAAIGVVASKNTAGVNTYSFTDNNVSSSVAYYRLKQVDKDGTFKYTLIETVTIKGGISFNIYPNPVTEVLTIEFPGSTSKQEVKVLSLDGRVLLRSDVAAGSTSTTLSVSSLNKGVYLLVLSGEKEQSTKFVKE